MNSRTRAALRFEQFSKYFWIAALVTAAVLLGLDAFILRWPEFYRNFWLDEFFHNCNLIQSVGFFELGRLNAQQYQPFVDFMLRKYFWFPVFGLHESSMRIPSLTWSVANVLVTFLGTVLALRQEKWERWWALIVGFVLATFVTYHTTEIHYSGEARHYSMVSFVSVCLFYYAFVLYPRSQNRVFLALLSFTAINTHFFFAVVLAPIFCMLFFEDLKSRRYRQLKMLIAVSLGIGIITIVANIDAFWPLLFRTPGAEPKLASMATLYSRFKEAWSNFLFLYGGATYLEAMLLCLVFLGMRAKRVLGTLAFFAWGFFFFPLFLFFVSTKSDAHLNMRYFTPFFGVFPTLFILAVLPAKFWAWRWVRRLAVAVRARRYYRPAGIIVAMSLVVAGTIGHIVHGKRAYAALRDVEITKDFTSLFYVYQQVLRLPRPLMIIRDSIYPDHESLLYWRMANPQVPYPQGIYIIGSETNYCDYIERVPVSTLTNVVFITGGAFPHYTRMKENSPLHLLSFKEVQVGRLSNPQTAENVMAAFTGLGFKYPPCTPAALK